MPGRRRQIIDGKLKCRRCAEWKLPDAFPPDNRAATGRQARCRRCLGARTTRADASSEVAARTERIRELYDQGVSIDDIATLMQVSRSTVNGHIRRFGGTRQLRHRWRLIAEDVEQRDRSTGCWVLTTTKPSVPGKLAYSSIYVPGLARSIGGHRFAHYLETGRLPPVVRHECDNPPCYNPDHLVPGTSADNVRDSIRRGRRESVAALLAVATEEEAAVIVAVAKRARERRTGGAL